MTWPAVQTKVRLDSAADDPKLARSELATNVDLFNQLQAHVSSFGQNLIDDADAAAGRATLGILSAALKNIGTSGDTVPVLNALANWSNAFLLSGRIDPSQITANQNNYNPSGLSGATQIFVDSDASRNVTGLVPGASAEGRLLLFTNDGSTDIVLVNQSASSTAANRFLFAGGDLTLAADQSVLLKYDATASRWRRAQDTSASGGGVLATFFTSSGTWTPDSGKTTALIVCTAGGGTGNGGAGATGGGGGAGATAIDFVSDTSAVGTPSVTIGAGGTSGDGGASSVGALAVAGGGKGGSSTVGGNGGAATAGDLQIDGGGGQGASTGGAGAAGGVGGASWWGGGGRPAGAGEAYGSGGGGANNDSENGDGKVGVAMILEW